MQVGQIIVGCAFGALTCIVIPPKSVGWWVMVGLWLVHGIAFWIKDATSQSEARCRICSAKLQR